MPKLSPEQWGGVEETVEEAEKAARKSHKASRELYEKSRISEGKRVTKEGRKESAYEPKTRVERKALEREEAFEKEAEDILGGEDSPERTLVRLQKKNLISALREERAINEAREKLIAEESEILKAIEGEPSGSELESLSEIREELVKLDSERVELLASSPEAYFGAHLKELKEYKNGLENNKLVETPYVRKQIEDIVAHLNANKPVMIYGHLGTGKTELAMHVARERIGKEALVISGSKHTTLAELYGHQVLTVDKESRTTVSDFFMGPIYRAMEEGRPVIIDEVNAIPHEVLISLNHILTRKVGEVINVQQDTGRTVTIKDGFGIIMTGNLNQGQERYVDRQELDPAFLSRLHKIEYDYLPQKNEGSLEEEAGPENELFHLLLAKTMDKNGNLEAPKDTLAKLWTLAKAARVTQDVFAGKEIQSAFYFQEGGSRATPYMLKESVMSIRAIEDIISQWQKEGYKRELDYYIWEEFISQSTEASDRAYLYQLLKDRFGFFRGEGWEQNPSYDSNRIAQSFDIKTPSNPAEEAEFFGPRDIVRAAFGAPPERAKWPEAEVSEKKEKEASLEALASLEEFKNALGEELANVEKEVAEVCEVGSGDSSPSPTTLSPKGKRGGFAGQVNKNEKKKEKNK